MSRYHGLGSLTLFGEDPPAEELEHHHRFRDGASDRRVMPIATLTVALSVKLLLTAEVPRHSSTVRRLWRDPARRAWSMIDRLSRNSRCPVKRQASARLRKAHQPELDEVVVLDGDERVRGVEIDEAPAFELEQPAVAETSLGVHLQRSRLVLAVDDRPPAAACRPRR